MISSYRSRKQSSVLIVTLLVLVLVSIIVLGLLASVTAERQNTESNYQQRRALSLAMLGFQTGVQQLRDALGTGDESWDDPYGNFATNQPSFYWSVSPGMLTRWSYTQAAPLTNIPLFSYTTDKNNTDQVNLNRPLADGSYPIIGGASPPDVPVQFVNILQYPGAAAGSTNRLVGRYAFWIDDESAKININVADGSRTKYTDDWMTNSLGLGNPTEESLLVLPQGTGTIAQTTASNIVQIARNGAFNSPREILRASGATVDLYTNNVFDLTETSRSADLNVFGQPKIALMPILGDSYGSASDMVLNAITLQPSTQIYPTPSQLPVYTVKTPQGTVTMPQQLAFRGAMGFYNCGYYQALLDGYWANYTIGQYLPSYGSTNGPYAMGSVLANYLAGTNVAGTSVNWPVFPNTSDEGFSKKYSERQIDEIVVQIVNLGSTEISEDYWYNTDSSGYYASAVSGYGNWRGTSVPLLFPGWLSGQWVCGTGRTPKLTAICVGVSTQGPGPSTNGLGPNGMTNYNYPPPYINMDFSEEYWLPGNYRGGNLLAMGPNAAISEGFYESQTTANTEDVDADVDPALEAGNTNYQNPGPFPNWYASTLPRPDGSGGRWMNQLLTNNQGVDFQGNPSIWEDPDQGSATSYHSPYAWNTNYGYTGFAGAGGNVIIGAYTGGLDPALNVQFIQYGQASATDPPDWSPGEIRTVRTLFTTEERDMLETAAGQNLLITGGIQQRAFEINRIESDIDPTPLESIRGNNNSGTNNNYFTMEGWTNLALSPGTDSTSTMRDRNMQSVIPVDFQVQVPTQAQVQAGEPGYTYYDLVQVRQGDPLVNKFPGDWVQSQVSAPPSELQAAPSSWASGGNDRCGFYYDYWDTNGFRATQTDPDSYWLPEADCGLSTLSAIATNSLIPRSARMPNIGYLQYIRTGIIPDDETNTSYTNQHGTPYRLLSYGPAGDTASQAVHNVTYPDWAMLDLLYVPSLLNSYGGPYSSYANSVYTNLAPFGTYGGATSGRINPNGAVIYTELANINQNPPVPLSNVVRTLPLQATLYGLHVNQTGNESSDVSAWPYADTNGTTVLDAPTSAALASNIAAFVQTNGPLRLPEEICDVGQVSKLHAGVNPTRNDLVRQMVGELTTQSNTFSVWTVGQVIQKASGNINYGEFQTGDQILGESRLHLIVERYLDPGSDGVYGNTATGGAGADGVVGTFDDLENNATHPFQPKYLYRVVRSEEIR